MPQKILWNPAFSVGNPTLDEQHKKLLAVCNALAECCEMPPSEGVSRFHELLDDLAKYARQHFAAEEGILLECGYPSLDEQKAEHFAFEEKLIVIISDATFGKFDIRETARFISQWWSSHILESDMKYKAQVSPVATR